MAKKKARKSSIVVFVRDRKSKDWRIVHPKRGRKLAKHRKKTVVPAKDKKNVLVTLKAISKHHVGPLASFNKFASMEFFLRDLGFVRQASGPKGTLSKPRRVRWNLTAKGRTYLKTHDKSAAKKRSKRATSYKGSALEAYNLARKAGKKYKGKKTRTRRRK